MSKKIVLEISRMILQKLSKLLIQANVFPLKSVAADNIRFPAGIAFISGCEFQ